MPLKLGFRDLSNWLRRGGESVPGRPVPYNDYVQPVEIVGDARLLTPHLQPTSAFAGMSMGTTAPDNDNLVLCCWSTHALVQELSAGHSAALGWGLGLFNPAQINPGASNLAVSNVGINVMNNDPPVRCTVNALVIIPAVIDVTNSAYKSHAANQSVTWSNIFVPAGKALVVGPDGAVGMPTGTARWSIVWTEFPA